MLELGVLDAALRSLTSGRPRMVALVPAHDEELLIGDNVSKTRHPKIMMASEDSLPFSEMENVLSRRKHACESNDHALILDILRACVSGFCPEDEIKDHLFGLSAAFDHGAAGAPLH